MKKKLLIGCIATLLLGGVVFGCYKFYDSKELDIDITKKIVVSLNDKVYNTDGVKSIKNGKVVDKKEVINTDKVGVKKIILNVEDFFKRNKTVSYEVEIKDTIAPKIEYEKELSTTEGEEIDLLKDVKATDNYDKEVVVKVEGKYDFNKPGEYKLQYVAKDSSKNETKEDFVVTVKKKVVVVEKKEEVKTVEKKEEKKESTNTETPKKEETTQPAASVTTNSDGSFTTSKGFHGETRNGVTYINGVLIANKTYSLPSSYAPGGLTGEVSNAANNMFAAAKAEAGYNMWAQSGFRSYATQQRLYNRYVSASGKAAADTYSARPGHSEHQTGLAFDVCATGKPCINSNFNSTPEAAWLAANAYKYGFILRYPSGKSGETGYKFESWHFRYVGVDLATKLYNGGNWITLEDYFGITSEYNY